MCVRFVFVGAQEYAMRQEVAKNESGSICDACLIAGGDKVATARSGYQPFGDHVGEKVVHRIVFGEPLKIETVPKSTDSL